MAVLLVTFSWTAQKVTTTADSRFDFKNASGTLGVRITSSLDRGRANDALIGQKIVQGSQQTCKSSVEQIVSKTFRKFPPCASPKD